MHREPLWLNRWIEQNYTSKRVNSSIFGRGSPEWGEKIENQKEEIDQKDRIGCKEC